MSSTLHWVVCAPGDPNRKQWEAIYRTAGSNRFCAFEYNYMSDAVRFRVEDASSETERIYIVADKGSVTEESKA